MQRNRHTLYTVCANKGESMKRFVRPIMYSPEASSLLFNMHFRSLAVFASGKQFALPALPDGESGLLFRFPASTCVTQCDPGHRLSSHLESRRLVANR